MGCDIHATIEVRRKFNDYVGEWQEAIVPGAPVEVMAADCGDGILLHELDIHRNYELFGLLAGVRDHDQPHVAPRGAPSDASPFVKAWLEAWRDDGHSHSWLTLEELRPFALREDSFAPIVRALQAYVADQSGVEARVVFFFDN